ncbi:MAG: inorganic phosphate transporter [Alphaproteobacteria bacterium]|jgi:inorganic phosphate transporter, PiT family|nr:inorganic phosphate transporter [Alphaproteobacteria bacterium]MBT4020499.1 inorganic phosphate transporter [Alphaproteobacteria bacterium]MBT4965009.1 inorganic phosphate transporter [Alphaproteobacteria bacterium]MBT5158262.1 inorganic phosphate transporter [Alphaproteobacteria bacterium]MBT5917989.1 inorganic phosphate transporter [Alphaproteobacteria bacterium]
MELKTLDKIEGATIAGRTEMLRLGVAILFIVGVMLYAGVYANNVPGSFLLVAAAVIGGYMAINIGANDVANNVGPAVGSKTLTLGGAIVIAAIFESAGAIIAGGDVVTTIRKGIISPDIVKDLQTFVWIMMAALLAGALWLNIATAKGLPVSTTHSIVGGVLGAGIAAGGWQIANWGKLAEIAASWVLSPVLGGIIAALFLYFIKRAITYQKDKIVAAKKMVPILIGLMAWAFSTYLILKGLKKIWHADFLSASLTGFGIAFLIYLISRPLVSKAANGLKSDKESVNTLFTIPLICAAALLSFSHGANDVANAVGPLAAIYDAVITGDASTEAPIPIWIMVVGAVGITVGLSLYGPKLIRKVGSEITELDRIRAFCIAMAASITVIIASQLGLPVSSTHVAIGAIFGVGFLREAIKSNYAEVIKDIELHHVDTDEEEVKAYLVVFDAASFDEKGEMLRELKKRRPGVVTISKADRKNLRREYREELVKRSAVIKIASAWIITVPVSGLMAAILYFMFRGMLLP